MATISFLLSPISSLPLNVLSFVHGCLFPYMWLPWGKRILFIIVHPIPKHPTWHCRSSKPIWTYINSWWPPVVPQALCLILRHQPSGFIYTSSPDLNPWSDIFENSCIFVSSICLCQIPRLPMVTMKSSEDLFISSKVNTFYKLVTDPSKTYSNGCIQSILAHCLTAYVLKMFQNF